MLKRRERLSRSEFDTLYKKGRRIQGGHFLYITSPAPQMKCGVVVSKKTAKHAVKRNTLRRRVFSALETQRENIAKKHLIVITRPTVTTLPFLDFKKELTDVLKKL